AGARRRRGRRGDRPRPALRPPRRGARRGREGACRRGRSPRPRALIPRRRYCDTRTGCPTVPGAACPPSTGMRGWVIRVTDRGDRSAVHPVDRRSSLRLGGGAAVGPAAVATTGAAAPAYPPAPATERPASPAGQFRAMWRSSGENIDWPSRSGLPAEAQQEEYLAWLDLAQELGLNAV